MIVITEFDCTLKCATFQSNSVFLRVNFLLDWPSVSLGTYIFKLTWWRNMFFYILLECKLYVSVCFITSEKEVQFSLIFYCKCLFTILDHKYSIHWKKDQFWTLNLHFRPMFSKCTLFKYVTRSWGLGFWWTLCLFFSKSHCNINLASAKYTVARCRCNNS